MYNTAFFDVDGTLIDSFEGVKYSLGKALARYGLSLPKDSVIKTFMGPPIERTVARFWRTDGDTTREIAEAFQTVYKTEGYKMGSLYPGIKELLESLRGVELNVVTNKNIMYAGATLEHFGIKRCFSGIYCTDRKNGIGKNEIISGCLSKSDNIFAVMIGDTLEDYRATEGNACDFIGVLYGFGLNKENTKGMKTAATPTELSRYFRGSL